MVYADFPADHVWKIQEKVWSDRQRKEKVVRQMYFVHPTVGECFFLHLLLIVVLGATSFEHFRLLVEHWDYFRTTHNGTRGCGKHVSMKTQKG
jgi:hypothetical protein